MSYNSSQSELSKTKSIHSSLLLVTLQSLAVFLKDIFMSMVSGALDFFMNLQVVHFFNDNLKHKCKHIPMIKMTYPCCKISVSTLLSVLVSLAARDTTFIVVAKKEKDIH